MQAQTPSLIASKYLQELKNTRVFVAGDIILDVYIEGKVSRISAEAPCPVLLESQKKYVPGGAGNVAANIANIGAEVQICGRVGQDEDARIVKDILKRSGVNTSALILEKHVPTTTKTRVMSYQEFTSNAHQLVRVDRESTENILKETHTICLEHFQTFLNEEKHCALVISDYGKGFLTSELVQDLIQMANKHRIPVVVDPKSLDVNRYRHATVIKPNLSEGRAFWKSSNLDKQFSSLQEEAHCIANHYLTQSQCDNIVMSMSQHGIYCIGKDLSPEHEKQALHFETKALQVADVSGAGDTLVAFLAMALAAQFSLSHAIELANVAAGIVCGKMGTAVVHLGELFEKIHSPTHQPSREKILNAQQLKSIVQDLRAKGQTIVFTNGCFDLLHAGHVQYLQKAKALGQLLVIGLNSDASVKKLKGSTRPIQTFDDRAQILAALSCTDFIVEFNEDTPLNLIRLLKPDVLVKGADYNFETTVGASDVVSWGGRVEHIEFLPGRSTSALLKILNFTNS